MSPPAGGAPCRRSLGSDATRIRRPAARRGVADRPRWALPGRGWPDTNLNTCATRREWEEEAAAISTASRAKTCPANRPTSYHHPPYRRREGVLDRGWGRAGRRRKGRADMQSRRAGRRQPEAARVPALDPGPLRSIADFLTHKSATLSSCMHRFECVLAPLGDFCSKRRM